MKRTALTLILMIMLIIAFTLTIFPSQVRAVNVKITSITPDTHHGKVGDSIHIVGTVNKTDGLYRIWFGSQNIISSNAAGNNVSAIFSVPKLPGGNYTVTLQDVDMNISVTEWFYIDTAYYVEARKPISPIQLQEGSAVEIWANITGGKPNTIYRANITVKLPLPRNETYKTLVTLTNTTTTGEGHNLTIIYPTNFNGTPNTNYVGAYTVAFNKTLDTDTFLIGLTNSTEYHRNENVSIKATGYRSNENVTIRINSKGKTIDSIPNVNATTEGIIHANWPIPSNTSVDTVYLVNITSTSLPPTTKNPLDVQSFIVPGFAVNITTRNLAREFVSDVTVRIFEKTNSVANVTSISGGLALTKLEIGNYTCQAFYKGEKVGELSINITGAGQYDFYCNLTNLKILVMAFVDGIETGVPEVKLYLSQVNQTLITNINGTAIRHSLLPNRTYILNASRYNMSPFNTTTIPQLPAQAWYNVTIYTPTVTLKINVTDGQNRLIEDEPVTAKEFMGGLYYSNNTVNGVAIIRCAIGKYKIEAYGKIDSNYVKLNETSVDLFQEKQILLMCKLYGLNVSVRVVDYFGQLIPNVDVVMKRETHQYVPSTKSSGLVTFNNIIGGELQIEVFLSGQANASLASTYYVDSSKVIEVKLGKYVLLAGFLVETSIVALMIIIVATVFLVLLIEVYRKKHVKPQQSQS